MGFFRGKDFRSEQVSNAEISLLIEIQKRGLNLNMNTQVPMRLSVEEDGVEGTFIDFYFSVGSGLLAVFLDGSEIHSRNAQSKRDDLIDLALERRNIRVKRYEYDAPLTKKRRMEIADDIEEEIKK